MAESNSPWNYVRSPIGAKTRVHKSDRGTLAVYLRYGWERYTPIVVSIESFANAIRKIGTSAEEAGRQINESIRRVNETLERSEA